MFAEEPLNAEGLATFTFTEFLRVERQPWTEKWFSEGDLLRLLSPGRRRPYAVSGWRSYRPPDTVSTLPGCLSRLTKEPRSIGPRRRGAWGMFSFSRRANWSIPTCRPTPSGLRHLHAVRARQCRVG